MVLSGLSSRFRKAEKAYPPVKLPHDSVQFDTSAQSKVHLGHSRIVPAHPAFGHPLPEGEDLGVKEKLSHLFLCLY